MNSNFSPVVPAWPDTLAAVDLALVRVHLEFLTPCEILPQQLMSLRRPLRMAARQVLESRSADLESSWHCLFEPELSADPVARRKFQKPAPAFVLQPKLAQVGTYEPGETLDLDVLLLGTGAQQLELMLLSLARLGSLGLVQGEGQFEITAVSSRDLYGNLSTIWLPEQTARVAPLLLTLGDWLDQTLVLGNPSILQVDTPARLLVDKKPLRQPRFDQCFPFMLRRVTSQLFAHCGLELELPFPDMLSAAQTMLSRSDLTWSDWKSLPGHQTTTEIGGFTGQYLLEGQALSDLAWIVATAGLLGIGKNAAYGSGQMSLRPQS